MRVETTRVGRRRATELTWRSALLIAVVVVFLVSLVSLSIAVVSARGSSTSAPFIHAQPGSLSWNGRDPVNVLILGVDAPSPHPAATGDFMIATLDPAGHGARLLSIPRDLWVTIPGFGPGTISQAYEDGGPRLALIVAESVTHVVLPYYLVLGSDGLRQLVDAYSGIDVRDDSFATARHPSALRHMSGSDAVRYLHAGRSSATADMQRMVREQEVLLALGHQAVRPQNLFQIAATVNAVGGSVATNFPYNRVPQLARLLAAVPRSHLRTDSLDYGSGTVADYKTNGMNVLLPDWQRIHAFVKRLFPPTLRRLGQVDVLNGSGAPGEAEGLTQWLRQVGMRVRRYGSADSYNYQQTEVVANIRARRQSPSLARAAAALLQAPIVTRSVHTSSAPVVVIIGRDYQDPSQQ